MWVKPRAGLTSHMNMNYGAVSHTQGQQPGTHLAPMVAHSPGKLRTGLQGNHNAPFKVPHHLQCPTSTVRTNLRDLKKKTNQNKILNFDGLGWWN